MLFSFFFRVLLTVQPKYQNHSNRYESQDRVSGHETSRWISLYVDSSFTLEHITHSNTHSQRANTGTQPPVDKNIATWRKWSWHSICSSSHRLKSFSFRGDSTHRASYDLTGATILYGDDIEPQTSKKRSGSSNQQKRSRLRTPTGGKKSSQRRFGFKYWRDSSMTTQSVTYFAVPKSSHCHDWMDMLQDEIDVAESSIVIEGTWWYSSEKISIVSLLSNIARIFDRMLRNTKSRASRWNTTLEHYARTQRSNTTLEHNARTQRSNTTLEHYARTLRSNILEHYTRYT